MRASDLRVAAAAALAFSLSTAAGAATYEWTNPFSGNYFDSFRWTLVSGSGSPPPASADTALFNEPGTYTVTFTSGGVTKTDTFNVTAGNVTFRRSSTTQAAVYSVQEGNVSGGSTLTIGENLRPLGLDAADFSVQNATVDIRSGSDVDLDNLDLGTSGSGTAGLISVSGSTTTLDISDTGVTSLGLNGATGTLHYAGESTGTILGELRLGVSGVNGSTGVLRVTGEASPTVTGLRVGGGNSSNALGEVDIDEASLNVDGNLFVGGNVGAGVGQIVIGEGGMTTAGAATINATGSVFVSNDSTWNANGDVTNFNTLDVSISSDVNFGAGVNFATDGGLSDFDVPSAGLWRWDTGGTLSVINGGDLFIDSTAEDAQFNVRSSGVAINGVGSRIVADRLVLGDAGDAALMTVVNSGSLTTDDGAFIGPQGTLQVTNASWFLDTDPVLVDGGTVDLNGANVVNDVVTDLTLIGGATFDTDGVFGFGSLSMNDGSELIAQNGIGAEVGDFAAFGGGTTVTAGGTAAFANNGSATFSTFAQATFQNLSIFASPAGDYTFDLTFGANITVNGIFGLGGGFSPGQDAILTVETADARLELLSTLNSIGNDAGQGAGILNIGLDGTVQSPHSVILEDTGVINIVGGTLRLNGISGDGQFNFVAGAVEFDAPQSIGFGTAFPDDLVLNTNRTLIINNTLTVRPAHTLTLDGGSLEVGSLFVQGAFDFLRGTLRFTDVSGLTLEAVGSLGEVVELKRGMKLVVDETLTVTALGLLAMVGGEVEADQLTNQGHVDLQGVTSRIRLAGDFSNDGLLTGDGRVEASLANATGGRIRAADGDHLRFVGAGHVSDGQIQLAGGHLEFTGNLDNNPAGDITGRGTLTVESLRNAGDIALSNGQTDIHGDIQNASGRVIISGNADVTFWDDFDNQATSADVKIAAGSSATFFGTYSGAGTSGAGEVFFEADVTPGFSPGVADFGGDVTFALTSRLIAELDTGAPGSDYDQINVAGDATLAGELLLQTLPGYTPTLGETFDIITAGALAGAFDSIAGIPLGTIGGDAVGLAVLYSPTGVTARVSLIGDVNLDDQVNVVDLGILATNWQAGETWADADFTGDGLVNLADLGALAGNWQAGVSSPSSATFADAWAALPTDVPEPTTLALLAVGGLTMCRRRAG